MFVLSPAGLYSDLRYAYICMSLFNYTLFSCWELITVIMGTTLTGIVDDVIECHFYVLCTCADVFEHIGIKRFGMCAYLIVLITFVTTLIVYTLHYYVLLCVLKVIF